MLEYRKSKSRNGFLKSPEDINLVYQLMDAWFMFLFPRIIKLVNLYCLKERSLGVYVCIEHLEDGKHITEPWIWLGS